MIGRAALMALPALLFTLVGCGSSVVISDDLGEARTPLETSTIKAVLGYGTVATCTVSASFDGMSTVLGPEQALIHELRLSLGAHVSSASVAIVSAAPDSCASPESPLLASDGGSDLSLDLSDDPLLLGADDVILLYAERADCDDPSCDDSTSAIVELDFESLD